jgi:TonB family protein
MPFPFDAEELAIHERRRLSRGVRKATQSSRAGLAPVTSLLDETADLEPDAGTALAETQSAAAPTEPVAPRRKRGGMVWLVAALATLLAASVISGAFLYYRNGLKPAPAAAPARAEVRASLGLAVERRGNDLVISWNRDAAIIAKADFGMLLIRGAAVSRDIPLTAEELRSGSVVYASSAEQVRFQLNVVVGDQVTREFLALVLPQAPGPAPERPATVTSFAGGNSKAPAQPSRTLVLNVPAPPVELRPFKPVETPQTAGGAPPRIDEPPPAAGAAPSNAETLSLLSRPVVSLAAPVEVPAAQKTASVETPASATAARPPLPTHQTIPALPTALRGAIWKATVVDVNVSVDATGNVVKAEAVPKAGLNPLLRDAAVQAARRWKFQPAQFDGHAVPANIVVQFNFAGSR